MKTNKMKIKEALHHHRLDEDLKAIEILELDELAEDGDAQLLLGQIYYRAHKAMTGVSRSYPKSRKHLLKALELGNTEAANELADMYYFGFGVKENYKKAESYWMQAAADNEMGQFDLANYYYDHLNEKIDEAIKLYKALIDKNEFIENSYLKLGRIYYRGLGVDKDVNEGISWLVKGVEAGDGNSCMDLAYIYYLGEDVVKDVEKAISLVEKAGKTELYEDDAPGILKLMRNGTLFKKSPYDTELEEEIEAMRISNNSDSISLDEEDDDFDDDVGNVNRTAKEIAKRALTLAAVISCAYGDDKNTVIKWLKKENLWNNVTHLEREFLSSESSEKSKAQFTWKIEALVPLLWVINKLDKMPAINKQCDTELLKKAVIWSPHPTKEYISSAALRDEDEISEEYEKIYDAHWVVRDAQLNNKIVPKKYDSEVVFERHYGFNWATGYMGQPWDEISTDT